MILYIYNRVIFFKAAKDRRAGNIEINQKQKRYENRLRKRRDDVC